MNILEVQKFFNTVLSEAVVFPERAALFRSLGVDGNDWPDGQAKAMMVEFQSLAKEKGEEYARFTLTPRIGSLEAHDALPEEQAEFQLQYDRARTIGTALQLSDRIRNAPLDVDAILEHFRRNRTNNVESFLLSEALDDVMNRQAKKIETGEIRVLIPGWEKLSRKVGGFNPGRVSLLVAKTGVGKTMFALNLTISATAHMPSLFVNMEMSKDDIVSRCLQLGAKLDSEHWYSGHWNFTTIADFRENTAKRKPLVMTDGRALTLNQIISQIIIARERHGLQFVVVDYDQKIRMGGREEEWQKVQRAIEDLEECAKANNVHIMVLAQGDDDGAVKSSKRAQQPAATIFEFYEKDGKYGLRSKKNRFGTRKWRMKVNCVPEMSLVTEGEIEDDTQMELKPGESESNQDQWWNKG